MIILKSNYSPKLAPDKQEAENIQMMYALLLLAGMDYDEFCHYVEQNESAAVAYTQEANNLENADRWERANARIKRFQNTCSDLLVGSGITIQNRMVISEQPGYFSHIETTVFKGYDKQNPVAMIERPVLDSEVESYVDNSTGYKPSDKHG